MNFFRRNNRRSLQWGLSLVALTTALVLPSAELRGQAVASTAVEPPTPSWRTPQNPNQAELFWGTHQSGIVTPPQHHLYFAAFDVSTTRREDLVKLMKAWTAAAARLTAGETAQPLEEGLKLAVGTEPSDATKGSRKAPVKLSADSGETVGMSPARLTLTFGFGPGRFLKAGKDRFGLASRRPTALAELPSFAGDQMVEGHTGGDLAIQACAEDPQVAFHAVRQLARIAEGVAHLRWVQTGFRPSTGERHLLGFSNGKGNPPAHDAEAMKKAVWCGEEAPSWMQGGTYIVTRRIRFAIEHWDHMPVDYQEKAVGEAKHPGGPTTAMAQAPSKPALEGMVVEQEAPPSHLDIVTPHAFQILRRSFSYNDGVNFTTERWPPWRQGLEYDAGMFFICFQRDPRTGFIQMYDEMSKRDHGLNQFWTHEGGGLFACPPGAQKDGYIGKGLLEGE